MSTVISFRCKTVEQKQHLETLKAASGQPGWPEFIQALQAASDMAAMPEQVQVVEPTPVVDPLATTLIFSSQAEKEMFENIMSRNGFNTLRDLLIAFHKHSKEALFCKIKGL